MRRSIPSVTIVTLSMAAIATAEAATTPDAPSAARGSTAAADLPRAMPNRNEPLARVHDVSKSTLQMRGPAGPIMPTRNRRHRR